MENNNWISVEERLPEDADHEVLAIDVNSYAIGEYHLAFYGFEMPERWCDNYRNAIQVTHWQPLPSPPKQ